MKTTKIVIKNLFGIKETELDGRSVEISGPKGSGKTSVLDSIRYALTNRSDRDYIVHRGADEGEIIIETDTGLSIDRKALPAKSAGTVKVRDGSLLQTRPAEFLSQIFTPLQLNPVEFTQLSRQEKEPRHSQPHRICVGYQLDPRTVRRDPAGRGLLQAYP